MAITHRTIPSVFGIAFNVHRARFQYQYIVGLACCIYVAVFGTSLSGGVARASEAIHGEHGRGQSFELKEDLYLGSVDGAAGDMFGRILDIAVSSRGRVYVLDNGFSDIKVFTSDGTYIATIGGEGEGPGLFNFPTALAIDRSDNLYVGDLSRITVFDSDGVFADTIERENPGDMVQSLRINNADELYVVALSVFDQTVINKYCSDNTYCGSFCSSYAAGIDVDVRAERSFAGGAIDLTPDSIIFTQKIPFELRRFSFSGQLLEFCSIASDFARDPIFETKGNSYRIGLPSASYSVVSIGKSGFLNTIIVQPGEHSDVGYSRIDWFDSELGQRGGITMQGRVELRCADDMGRLWAIVDKEAPGIARYRWRPLP